MPRHAQYALGATIALAVATLVSTPANAQFDGAFGIQVARGSSAAASTAGADAPSFDSTAWIDPAGFGQPVQISRGFTLAAPHQTPIPCENCGGALSSIQGVVLLPVSPRHQVWWDWTEEYRRFYAGRVY